MRSTVSTFREVLVEKKAALREAAAKALSKLTRLFARCLVPTHREALIEKKAARREAAKAREDSPELMRVTGGGDVMGGDDSFQAARAR